MSEQALDTLANVAITLAAFSGLVVTFRVRGLHVWSPTELRVLWFLVIDSFLVVFFALLPVPLALANWSPDVMWGLCSALLGSWFLVGGFLALRGELRDRAAKQWVTVRWFTAVVYGIYLAALVMGVLLWLSVWDLVVFAVVELLGFIGLMSQQSAGPEGGLVPRGQALYVLGLIVLLAFAAVEFLYFIGLMSQRGREEGSDDSSA